MSGIVLEDQVRAAKQPGDAGAIGVVSVDETVRKPEAAVAATRGSGAQIIARVTPASAHAPASRRGADPRRVRIPAPGIPPP